MLNPGEEVLIPQPSYVSYVPCAVLAGGKPVIIELEERISLSLQKEKAAGEDYSQHEGSDSSVPEQPDGRHHGAGRFGGDSQSN